MLRTTVPRDNLRLLLNGVASPAPLSSQRTNKLIEQTKNEHQRGPPPPHSKCIPARLTSHRRTSSRSMLVNYHVANSSRSRNLWLNIAARSSLLRHQHDTNATPLIFNASTLVNDFQCTTQNTNTDINIHPPPKPNVLYQGHLPPNITSVTLPV